MNGPWKNGKLFLKGFQILEDIYRRFVRNNQKKELPMMAMFVNRSGRNEQSL
jgi:hypothetical protein